MPARRPRTVRTRVPTRRLPRRPAPNAAIISALERIESAGGAAAVEAAPHKSIEVSHLDKVFFPDAGVTKGDVMRYYVRVAKYILPAIADRPLVLKRTPEGVNGELFFQQNAPDDVPDGVRVDNVAAQGEPQCRFVGGDLPTLLHLVQLGCISLDPWMSRIGSLDHPDYSIIDLDPGPGASFKLVARVALWVREALDELGLRAVPKTSGSRGIHIAIPLPRSTSYQDSIATAKAAAARVVDLHPRQATVERALENRPRGTVYVDCLQNSRGKSVAAAYAVRAKPDATVSAPLTWDEVVESLDPREFTVRTMPARVEQHGDLWREGLKHGNSASVIRAIATPGGKPRASAGKK
ncbi:MAG TPA: non-homologous end-joining DNA ligase [Candidatus Tumulicola sp.]|nr:non-homologous end-joining DNA ligase [Candidatus Tumulicola sp.]HSC32655.1 non-homologous end-joining DNA ligase [Gemmatimonadaceae bacterium]